MSNMANIVARVRIGDIVRIQVPDALIAPPEKAR
jgi:hypothetical protein